MTVANYEQYTRWACRFIINTSCTYVSYGVGDSLLASFPERYNQPDLSASY